MSLEGDIAWHRQKAEQTLASITQLESEPDSPAREQELHILTQALGRYMITAELLEAQRVACRDHVGERYFRLLEMPNVPGRMR